MCTPTNGCGILGSIINSTKPGQVAHAKKGEQVVSPLVLSGLVVADGLSGQLSSAPQQGTTVPAVVTMSNIRASHIRILRKGRNTLGSKRNLNVAWLQNRVQAWLNTCKLTDSIIIL